MCYINRLHIVLLSALVLFSTCSKLQNPLIRSLEDFPNKVVLSKQSDGSYVSQIFRSGPNLKRDPYTQKKIIVEFILPVNSDIEFSNGTIIIKDSFPPPRSESSLLVDWSLKSDISSVPFYSAINVKIYYAGTPEFCHFRSKTIILVKAKED